MSNGLFAFSPGATSRYATASSDQLTSGKRKVKKRRLAGDAEPRDFLPESDSAVAEQFGGLGLVAAGLT